MRHVQVADSTSFAEEGTGQQVVPFGCNYFDPATGWAPKIWQQFDPVRVGQHFDQMAELGVNTVRVFVSIASFMTESGDLVAAGMDAADQMVEHAKRNGIRVELTGPDRWEAIPEWAAPYFDGEVNAYWLHPEWIDRLAAYWSQFARHYRDEGAVFGYDLLNEPWLMWDSPLLREHFGGPVPEGEYTGLDGSAYADLHELREQLLDRWTSTMVEAIRSADPRHMVTFGFHQDSLPERAEHRFTRPGFNAKRLTPLLDYVALHWYPWSGTEHVRPLTADAPIERDVAIVRSSIENARAGKPIVLEEFGWYGGGEVESWGEDLPYVSEELQVHYLNTLLDGTEDLLSGWLTWGYADVPASRDITKKSGLVDEHGKVKLWGRTFAERAQRIGSRGVLSEH